MEFAHTIEFFVGEESKTLTEDAKRSSPFIDTIIDNRFHIEEKIGEGGMGTVYRASDLRLERSVAIKLLLFEADNDVNVNGRFLREARAAARIDHYNVVSIYDYGTLDQVGAFIVMEYIHGFSLRDLLNQWPFSNQQVLKMIKPICNAVFAAHKAGVIHRDLKPENIMLKKANTGEKVIKVVDFGLARFMESINPPSHFVTAKSEILGTPFYMSPEQCVSSKIDEKADIYALGIILYELLAGETPFQGSIAAVMRGHMQAPVPSLKEVNRSVTDELEHLVLNMLHKQKEQRPSLKEIIERLEKIEQSSLIVPDTLEKIVVNCIADKIARTATPQDANTLQHSGPSSLTSKLPGGKVARDSAKSRKGKATTIKLR